MIPMGTIPAWHAERRPDVPALIVDGAAWTWAELARATADGAAALRAAGVGPDDRVVLVLPNGLPMIAAIFAIWAVGATPCPLSPGLPPAERAALLDLAQPRLVIEGAWAPPPSTAPFACAAPARYWKGVASGGSTGRPKLILSDRVAATDPTRYELFPWEVHGGRLGRPGGVTLTPGPLNHNGPFVHAVMNLFAGSTLIGMGRFDAREWLALVERHGVVFSYLVPTMMHRIWMLPAAVRQSFDLGSLGGILHTAAPCPPWLKRAWIDWLGPERVWEAYGSTEAVAASLISGAEWLDHPGSAGRFFFGASGRIADEADARCPSARSGYSGSVPRPARDRASPISARKRTRSTAGTASAISPRWTPMAISI